MTPLVSILIPAHNAQDWIADTLRSALAQTWPRTEIIVVDDGSTDRTLAIARRFASDALQVVTQRNQGASAARNAAYALSRGEYIQWLDADDLLAPDKIARQMEARDSRVTQRTLLSGAWAQFLYRYQRAPFVPTALWADLSPAEWLIRKLDGNLHMQTATWLVSRALTDAAGPWDTGLPVDDDGEYFCRVLLASVGVRFVPEAKVYYRAAGSSSVSYIGKSDLKIRAQWRSMQLHIRYLRSLEDTERVRAACLRYLQNWLLVFYPERRDILQEMEDMALRLGGRLEAPALSWKYTWIRALFGWGLAKQARRVLPGIRWTITRWWDRTMLRIEHGGSRGPARIEQQPG
jgi:glycosyltransferase involved in cell wall biosynthesis